MNIGPYLNSKLCLKKGRPHGYRHGKTPEKNEYHIAHNLRERCIKRHYEEIHDRFLKDPVFRESQIEIDRPEEVCIQMDEIAQKDFELSHHAGRLLWIQKELVDLSQ